jgi:hypothetical protein
MQILRQWLKKNAIQILLFLDKEYEEGWFVLSAQFVAILNPSFQLFNPLLGALEWSDTFCKP